MRQLEKISDAEAFILTAIIALALELPGDLVQYAEALGELRRKYFKIPGRTRGENLKGFIDGHQVRPREPWA